MATFALALACPETSRATTPRKEDLVLIGTVFSIVHGPDDFRRWGSWLKALEKGDLGRLGLLTALPFVYGEAWPKKQCSARLKNRLGLRRWLGCVRKNEDLLIRELGRLDGDPSLVHLALGAQDVSDALRNLAGAPSVIGTWVSGYVAGDGVTYQLLFRLEDRERDEARVTALFVDVSFDQG